MGGRRLVPSSVVPFPVPRALGDILQSWARRCPEKLKALERLVIFIDSQHDADIAAILRQIGKP